MFIVVFTIPISFSLAGRHLLNECVVDKQTKMKEALKIMSLKTEAYGLSYFLSQGVFALFTSFIITVAFTI
jgi:hypothetical protein